MQPPVKGSHPKERRRSCCCCANIRSPQAANRRAMPQTVDLAACLASGALQPRQDAFSDPLPLELGDCTEGMKLKASDVTAPFECAIAAAGIVVASGTGGSSVFVVRLGVKEPAVANQRCQLEPLDRHLDRLRQRLSRNSHVSSVYLHRRRIRRYLVIVVRTCAQGLKNH